MQEHEQSRRLRQLEAADHREYLSYTAELSKRFVADFPDFPYGWIYLGDSLYGLARYSEALRAFRRALRLCPKAKLFMVYARLGHLYSHKGNFRQAEAWYRRAIAGNPSDAGYRVFLGGLLAIAGRLREAETVHRRATLCKKGCIDEAYLNLGLVLRAQERYREALKCFRKALRLDPGYKQAKKEIADVQSVLQQGKVTAPPPRPHFQHAG
jgi:tetratricopeptide (TPR) repeat protein